MAASSNLFQQYIYLDLSEDFDAEGYHVSQARN
jgi:hypothetical protein